MYAPGKISLAIFASGGGSNAAKILAYFDGHPHISIALIVYNQKDAGVRLCGQPYGVPAIYWTNKSLQDKALTTAMLQYYHIDGIVLAGFLSLIPKYLVDQYTDKILNIHPALLPQFGGKGMYGHHVHRAVSAAGVALTGLSIHVVDSNYDQGRIIFQHLVPIEPHANPEEIQKAVLENEHKYYPGVIEQYFKKLFKRI